eukprot:349031-Alexandrium_andersonii.AAC.1
MPSGLPSVTVFPSEPQEVLLFGPERPGRLACCFPNSVQDDIGPWNSGGWQALRCSEDLRASP